MFRYLITYTVNGHPTYVYRDGYGMVDILNYASQLAIPWDSYVTISRV